MPSPPGEISRSALVNRLRAAHAQSVAAIVAPAGYGKTVLFGQWSAREERTFIRVECLGLDGCALVEQVAEAFDAGASSRPAQEEPQHWIWRTAVPRLARALRAADRPFVLAFDDAHELDADGIAVVTALIRHVPQGSLVALAGRSQPLPSLPRLRAGGGLLELGVEDIAFTRREARALLRTVLGVAVSEQQVDEVLERTEGWAAGIALAALSLPVQGRSRPSRSGRDRDLWQYVEAECLAALTPDQRAFLRRTSILGHLSGGVCDAVLELDDSAHVLAELAHAGAFLVPLDRDGSSYRCHSAVREHLRRELAEQEPRIVPELDRRAAAWFEANGEPERALRHRYAAGDVDEVARILDAVASELHNDGRDQALVGWLALLGRGSRLEDHPEAAVLGALLHVLRGDEVEAKRFLDAAVRGARSRRPGRSESVVGARIALVRAAMCADGAESMLADAEHGLDHLPPEDGWRPIGLLLQGVAYALLDEAERADAILARAVHASTRLGKTVTEALALTQRALLAVGQGDRVRAGQWLDSAVEAIRGSDLESYPTSGLTLAAAARFELLHGHSPRAFEALASARSLLAGLGPGLPWLGVQTRLELAEADVTLRDSTGAGASLADIDRLLAGCPGLGILCRHRDRLAAEIEAVPTAATGRPVGLTAAELRLVPMLATHLSFREIGARFFLSRNTVKTQAISVYRKLGASSRSEAVVRAHSLGLIEEGADAPDGLIRMG